MAYARGAYALTSDDGNPDVLLMASGSEVTLCLKAHEQLHRQGVSARVISMPSWELFEQQDQDYRDQVLPPHVNARVATEQASTLGWGQYLTATGEVIGMKTFGASEPLAQLQKKFGFTPEAIAEAALNQIKQIQNRSAVA